LTWFSGTSFRRYLANRSGDFGRALTTRIDEVRPPEFSGAVSHKIPRKGEVAMPVINGLCVGESLVGEGNEVAHIDLIMGPRGSAAESAFAHALTNNKDGFTSLLAVVAPNLLCKPATVLFNKVTIKGAKQAVQMFGPAQHAVAKAVADSVAEGVIPQSEADDLFICVGVFIHWEASDDKKIQDFNYQATKEAIARAVKGEPKASEVVAKRNEVKHPFAA
jgi:5,6,7,8-tetrahydromethanopterin hydro-lyase